MFGRLPPEINMIQKKKEGRLYSRDDEIHIVRIFMSTFVTSFFLRLLEYAIRLAVGWVETFSNLGARDVLQQVASCLIVLDLVSLELPKVHLPLRFPKAFTPFRTHFKSTLYSPVSECRVWPCHLVS